MTEQYMAQIDGEERGPYYYADLELCERIGDINPMTKVRQRNHDIWKEWGLIKMLHEQEKERCERYKYMTSQFPDESENKHSILKIIIGFWIVCSVLGAVGGLFGIVLGAVLAGIIGLVTSAFTGTVCFFIFRALDER